MKHLLYFLVALAAFSYSSVAAQQNEHPTISGVFKYIHKELPDSLVIKVFPRNRNWESVKYFAKLDKDSSFSIRIPNISSPAFFAISCIKGGKNVGARDYYLEAGDSVQLTYFEQQIISGQNSSKRDSVLIAGRNADKYNLIETLEKHFASYLSAASNLSIDIRQLSKQVGPDSLYIVKSHFYYLADLYNEFNSRKQSLIYNTSLTADLKKIIGYRYASLQIRWFSDYYVRYKNFKNEDVRNYIRESLRSHYSSMVETNPPDLTTLSIFYYQYLSSMLINGEKILHNRDEYNLEDYYDRIVKDYSGAAREALLIELFKGQFGTSGLSKITEVYDSLIADAAKYLTSGMGIDIIQEKLTFKKGTLLFEGIFVTLEGVPFSTKALSDKVFLIEMWGQGCSACANFHTKFKKEMWPLVKSRKDFVVLSIFDGRSFKAWQQCIASGIYTSNEYINVSNIPLTSANHPFMKYYNINYAPFLLLVGKDGRIISRISGDIKAADFINLIDSGPR